MNFKAAIVLASIFFTPVLNSYADLTMENFSKLKKGSKVDKHSLEMYIGGVGKGYLWANSNLSMHNQQRLFCFDGDFTTQEFLKIASDEVRYVYSINPNEKETPIELILLIKLQKMYPCKKQ